jgi:hypothetical protein
MKIEEIPIKDLYGLMSCFTLKISRFTPVIVKADKTINFIGLIGS